MKHGTQFSATDFSRGCDGRHRRSRLRPIPEDRIRFRGHSSEGVGLRGGQSAFISGTAPPGAWSSWAGHRSEQFFINAFERMGTHGEERTALPPQGSLFRCTRSFSTSPRRRVTRRSWPAVLAAEWMYLTWCSTANHSPSLRNSHSGLGGSLRRWRVCRSRRLGPLGN